MAGLKILPIRKKSIEKCFIQIECKRNKKSLENTKRADMTYPQEYFLMPTTRTVEEKKTN